MTTKLGTHLIKAKLISKKQLEDALQLQQDTGGKIGAILAANVNIRALDFYRELAKYFNLPFAELLRHKPDTSLLDVNERDFYVTQLILPIKKEDDYFIVATAEPNKNTFNLIKTYWGENVKIVVASKFDILWTVQNFFQDNYTHEIINELFQNNSEFSAKKPYLLWQQMATALLITLAIAGIIWHPIKALAIKFFILTCILFTVVSYRLLLTIAGLFLSKKYKNLTIQAQQLKALELPTYTILVALYKEKEVTLRELVKGLKAIDYPAHKLDIKLLLELDDTDTINTLKKFKLPSYFEFIYIPNKGPKTKPKALNYGLKFAKGEYVTLYDSEDIPELLQLKKALVAFSESKANVFCVQCQLNYYNAYENWLTKMFTLEYTYWYDLMIPSLQFFGAPIPLGGTSNHFKTEILRKYSAWDPYNVTEDADLGVRFHRLGYRTVVIPSTTYEEANCQLINWIKQRSRWIKGYFITYIVHMRNPIKLWRQLGTRGFLGLQLFIGGSSLTSLFYLPLWLMFFFFLFYPTKYLSQLYFPHILKFAWFNLITGTGLVILLNLIAVMQRKLYRLFLPALTAPIYWGLMSIASYRALYQAIFKPDSWDKTEHGLSKTLMKGKDT